MSGTQAEKFLDFLPNWLNVIALSIQFFTEEYISFPFVRFFPHPVAVQRKDLAENYKIKCFPKPDTSWIAGMLKFCFKTQRRKQAKTIFFRGFCLWHKFCWNGLMLQFWCFLCYLKSFQTNFWKHENKLCLTFYFVEQFGVKLLVVCM